MWISWIAEVSSRFCSSAEDGEIDAAVLAVFQEVGVLGEIVVLAVFEDEDAVGFEQSALDNEIGKGRNFLQGVWWIGKDEVELLFT